MVIGSIAFGLLMVLATWLDERIGLTFPKFSGQLYKGFVLLFLWSVVGVALRLANRANRFIDAWRLILVGVFIAIVGAAAGVGFNRLAAVFQETWEVPGLSGQELVFFGGVGLTASVLALINVKIKSRILGNLLELSVIAALIYLLYHFMA